MTAARIYGIGIAVLLSAVFGVSLAETAEMQSSSGAERQIEVEMIVLKVELGAKNEFGLDWGKENKMRKGDFGSIAKWLKSQGELKVLCNRRFLATDGKEMRVVTGIEAPIIKESRVSYSGRRRTRSSVKEGEPGKAMPSNEGKEVDSKRRGEPERYMSFEYKDFGNQVTLTPRIQENKIAMYLRLFVKFMQGRSGVKETMAFGKYEIKTNLLAKNGETLILDDLVVNETVSGGEGVARTALVTFITPHIVE